MRQRQIELVIKQLSQIGGGPSPTAEEMEELRLDGVTDEELEAAELLWMEGHSAAEPVRGEQAVRWAYLARAAPGMPIDSAIDSLTANQREVYDTLEADDLERLDTIFGAPDDPT